MQLDRTTMKVLKHIKKNPEISIDELKEKFGNSLGNSIDYLLSKKLIYQPIHSVGGGTFAPAHYYSISAKGNPYFQHKFGNAVYKLYPYIISTISIILSIIALITSLSNN